MKKFVLFFAVILACFGISGCVTKDNPITNESYLRIHIRANSNLSCDQEVKYLVRDAVVEYLTSYVASVQSKEELIRVLSSNMNGIEQVADMVLEQQGFDYTSTGRINNEYFPTRSYGEVVLEGDYYDALILELGTGNGNNWWCVVYPPLCFADTKALSGTVKYKSKIMELIQKFFG